MRSFEVIQLIFTTFGLCSTVETVSWQKTLIRRLLGLTLCTCIAAGIVASSVFIERNFTTDLLGCAFALFQFFAGVSVLLPMMGAFLYRNKIGQLFYKIYKVHGW